MFNPFKVFKRELVHLCPEVRGRITLDGAPLQNLKVYRALNYDGSIVDSTATSEDGSFHLPEKSSKSNKWNKPWEFDQSVAQEIWTEFNGREFCLWYTAAGGIREHATITEKLSKLEADLSNPKSEYWLENQEYPESPHAVLSICDWNDYIEKYGEQG